MRIKKKKRQKIGSQKVIYFMLAMLVIAAMPMADKALKYWTAIIIEQTEQKVSSEVHEKQNETEIQSLTEEKGTEVDLNHMDATTEETR